MLVTYGLRDLLGIISSHRVPYQNWWNIIFLCRLQERNHEREYCEYSVQIGSEWLGIKSFPSGRVFGAFAGNNPRHILRQFKQHIFGKISRGILARRKWSFNVFLVLEIASTQSIMHYLSHCSRALYFTICVFLTIVYLNRYSSEVPVTIFTSLWIFFPRFPLVPNLILFNVTNR